MSDDRYSALYRLWQVYLHMRAWGQPEYEELDADARENFTELVNTGALFAYVEDCKRDVLRAGVDAPATWLSPLSMSRLVDGALPKHDRDMLGGILHEIYLKLVRLDPDAQPDSDRPHQVAPRNRGGRPRLSPDEERRREEIVTLWLQAKQRGQRGAGGWRVSRREFCSMQGIDAAHLRACLDWWRQRARRAAGRRGSDSDKP